MFSINISLTTFESEQFHDEVKLMIPSTQCPFILFCTLMFVYNFISRYKFVLQYTSVYLLILGLTSRRTVTSARIPEEDACHRGRYLCVFSRVQKGTPGLTHKGCVLQRVFLDTLNDITVVLGMRQSIVFLLFSWCCIKIESKQLCLFPKCVFALRLFVYIILVYFQINVIELFEWLMDLIQSLLFDKCSRILLIQLVLHLHMMKSQDFIVNVVVLCNF